MPFWFFAAIGLISQPVLAAEFCPADCVPLPTLTINDVTVVEAAVLVDLFNEGRF